MKKHDWKIVGEGPFWHKFICVVCNKIFSLHKDNPQIRPPENGCKKKIEYYDEYYDEYYSELDT